MANVRTQRPEHKGRQTASPTAVRQPRELTSQLIARHMHSSLKAGTALGGARAHDGVNYRVARSDSRMQTPSTGLRRDHPSFGGRRRKAMLGGCLECPLRLLTWCVSSGPTKVWRRRPRFWRNYRGKKHIKGLKECYWLGQNTTCEFSGLSIYQATIIIINEICKAPILRLNALYKHSITQCTSRRKCYQQ